MYQTNYHRAGSLDEAKAMLDRFEDARLIAGGHTLLPAMKMRLFQTENLIDISRLPELKGISVGPEGVGIGAGVTHGEVATDPQVRRVLPALSDLAGLIGDPAVRHVGSIGGSLANNDPASDYPAAVLALNATVHTTQRSIPADEYFLGMFETALEPGEIITRVTFPIPSKAGYAKFRQPASRYALTGVFVARLADEAVRVAVTGAASCVFRSTPLEAALSIAFTVEGVRAAAPSIPSENLNSDIHGSAEYRAALIAAMAEDAVTQALAA